MTPMRWTVAQPDVSTQRLLAAATGLSPLLCQLLINRGITDAAAVRTFLSPSLHDLPDPFLLRDMQQAVERLVAALAQKELIAVYGDYDVDGVTATALLLTFFRELGVHVLYHIPERAQGYGLNAKAIQNLAQRRVRVLITVDCGITAVDEIALARRLGIDTIVTDHHHPPDLLPDALALLNPNQPLCTYPHKGLCGVGVVFKLLVALRAALRKIPRFADRLPNLKRHLDLVTLGTVADVTPLREENRVIVYHGLRELTRTRKSGLHALRLVSGRADQPATVGEVGFQLAPRLNASGRLGSAAASVNLLLADNPHDASCLAAELNTINRQRRDLQQTIEQAVHDRIARQYGGRPPAALVLGDPAWHHGVIGIVAAKIAQTYHRPTFLLQIDGKTARGSGRSIPAFNLYAGLQHCARWLQRFGGHKYAAGLSMDADLLPSLQEDFIRFAEETLAPDDLQPTLSIDAVVSLPEITPALAADLDSLAPYGPGNPTPILCAHNVQMASPPRLLGADRRHARFRVVQDGATLDVIAFQMAAQVTALADVRGLDLAFSVTINTWQGRQNVELQLRALRPHTTLPAP